MHYELPRKPFESRSASTLSGHSRSAWFALASCLLAAFSIVQVLRYSFGSDQAMFALIGDGILAGRMPYRDLWDIKPPGIYLLYATAHALFGSGMQSIRVVEAVGLIGLFPAFRRLAGHFGLPDSVAIASAGLAALLHAQLGFWHTAQPEGFGGFLTVWALALSARYSEAPHAAGSSRSHGASAGAGVLLGCAFLMKPQFGAGALVCAYWVVRDEWRRTHSWRAALSPACVMTATAALPSCLALLWLSARGAWPAFSWTLFEFVPQYTRLSWTHNPLLLFALASGQLAFFSWLIPVGMVAALALPAASDRERSLLCALFTLVLIHALGIAVQAKFFIYHCAGALPLLAFIAALGWCKLWNRVAVRRRVLPRLLLVASVMTLDVARAPLCRALGLEKATSDHFWSHGWQRVRSMFADESARLRLDAALYRGGEYSLDDTRVLAQELASVAAPDATIYVWGYEPAVYWLAGREPASRYVTHAPQRAFWQHSRARQELLHDLGQSEPRVIVVRQHDPRPYLFGDDLDSKAALETFPELSSLLAQRYRYTKTLRVFDVYVRR